LPVTGLDHVQVAAPREPGVEDRARAFYGGLFGLREIEKPSSLKSKGGVWFSLGSVELHVGIEDGFSPARKAHPALVVSDLPALERRLREVGAPVVAAEPIPGVHRFYTEDPFGNRLELISRGDGWPQPEEKREAAKLGWRVLGTEYPVVTPWLRVRRDHVETPGGEITYTYMEGSAAVGIVPVTRDGRVLLVREYRYTVDDWCLEVPAGGSHDAGGASLEAVARKELREETGAECGELIPAGWFYASNGSMNQRFHVYLALDVEITGEPEHEETEMIEVVLMPLADTLSLVHAGEMRDGVSALSVMLCESLLRERGYV
jgi:ADP-ribose pyrophosphatase